MAKAPPSPLRVFRRLIRARDVFGKPIEADGVTLVPVASVMGGGGGAESTAGNPGPEGGLGFGFMARPLGAFEIRDGKTRWRPVVDVTTLTLAALLSGLVVARWVLKNR
jgi:uncharacterized spore protein YtfJ